MACALRSGPDVVVGAVKGNRFVSCCVVGPHWTCHDHQSGFVRFFNTQGIIHSEVQRAEVESITGFGRDPSLFNLDKLLEQVHKLMSVEIGHCQSLRGLFESEGVALWSEQSDLSILVFIGFQAFVALDSVVEPRYKGTEIQIMEWLQLGMVPAIFDIPIDMDHMICVELAEGHSLGVVVVREGEELLPQVPAHLAGLSG